MISLVVGLVFISAGAMLMWTGFIQTLAWLFIAIAIGDKYKSGSATFKFPWYHQFLPVPLVFAGVLVLVLR
jgi:hypothetical protein